MCLLIRLVLLKICCFALPCVAQCDADTAHFEYPDRASTRLNCEPGLALSMTTRKRWQLNVGVLESYRADAKLPLGMRAEKSDNSHRWVEVTRILKIEKRF